MWLKKKVDDMLYPPRIILDIYYHKYQAIVEHCDITLQVTGLRGCHDRDTSLNIHVHSDMFSEQTGKYLALIMSSWCIYYNMFICLMARAHLKILVKFTLLYLHYLFSHTYSVVFLP